MITRTISVPGFRIGTAQDRVGLTGVTVILAPEGGATAGVDVRGCAPRLRTGDAGDGSSLSGENGAADPRRGPFRRLCLWP